MDWSTFLTIVGQTLIVLVILFIVAAVISGIVKAEKKK